MEVHKPQLQHQVAARESVNNATRHSRHSRHTKHSTHTHTQQQQQRQKGSLGEKVTKHHEHSRGTEGENSVGEAGGEVDELVEGLQSFSASAPHETDVFSGAMKHSDDTGLFDLGFGLGLELDVFQTKKLSTALDAVDSRRFEQELGMKRYSNDDDNNDDDDDDADADYGNIGQLNFSQAKEDEVLGEAASRLLLKSNDSLQQLKQRSVVSDDENDDDDDGGGGGYKKEQDTGKGENKSSKALEKLVQVERKNRPPKSLFDEDPRATEAAELLGSYATSSLTSQPISASDPSRISRSTAKPMAPHPGTTKLLGLHDPNHLTINQNQNQSHNHSLYSSHDSNPTVQHMPTALSTFSSLNSNGMSAHSRAQESGISTGDLALSLHSRDTTFQDMMAASSSRTGRSKKNKNKKRGLASETGFVFSSSPSSSSHYQRPPVLLHGAARGSLKHRENRNGRKAHQQKRRVERGKMYAERKANKVNEKRARAGR